MACIFNCEFSRLKPGDQLSLGQMDENGCMIWMTKTEPVEGFPYNAVDDKGKFYKIEEDAEVLTGYGFGHR